MNPCDDSGFQDRIEAIIRLCGSVAELSRKSHLSRGVIGKYQNGESDPSRSRLIALAQAAGVRVEWLATGEGPMRNEPAAADGVSTPRNTTAGAVDDELLARVGEEIADMYRQENARISQRQLARLQARLYGDLVAAYDDQAERLVGLKGMIQQLRRDLRETPAAGGDASKRLA